MTDALSGAGADDRGNSSEESQMTSELLGLGDWRIRPAARLGHQHTEDVARSGARPDDEDRLRVVVADTDALRRCGLASLLEAKGMCVLGQAGDVPTLMDLIRSHRPALVVVHQRLCGREKDAPDAALKVRQEYPDVGIVVLATRIDVEPSATLVATGTGIGYVLEQHISDVDDFTGTLRRVARGGSVVDPALVCELVAAGRHRDPLDVLSPRERDVLSHMARGRSNHGIAEALWVTPATVEKHVHSILAKLDLPDGATDHRRVLAVLTFLRRR
jgi:DNA-binding NarL/FixJ family response regulator